MHDHNAHHRCDAEANAEEAMLEAARIRSELFEEMTARVSEDPAWDIRAHALGYVDDDVVLRWHAECWRLEHVAEAMDDIGYWCRECGGDELVPGYPGDAGPVCTACDESAARNACLRAVGGDL